MALKRPRSMVGLAEVHQPHLVGVMELVIAAWGRASLASMERYTRSGLVGSCRLVGERASVLVEA